MSSNKDITAEFELIDSDNDGISNDLDKCPDTPTGATVDSNGCSSKQLDADGDGVTDDVDVCPETPSGATVDEQGCADSQKDTDGDGVTDDVDNCILTINPDQADSDGDSIGNVCDNCTGVYNPDQMDWNNNGWGDKCGDPQNLFSDNLKFSLNFNDDLKDMILDRQIDYYANTMVENSPINPVFASDRFGNMDKAIRTGPSLGFMKSSVDTNIINGEWTLSFWAKAENSRPYKEWFFSAGISDERFGNNGKGYLVGFIDYTLWSGPSVASGDRQAVSVNNIENPAKWNHYVVVNKGDEDGTIILYMNGLVILTSKYGGVTNVDVLQNGEGSDAILWIGRQDVHPEYFDGLIDDYLIYDKALSENEVLLLFSN